MSFDILSLEELSYDIVKDNFSRYLLRYTSKKENMDKNFVFLKRLYSQQLFCDFDKIRKLKKEHLDFLLNKNLRVLNISPLLTHLKEAEILDKFKLIADNLQELSYLPHWNCSDSALFSAFEKLLPYSGNVEKVTVNKICNDKLLESIASSCPKLADLDIRNSNITGRGIETLCSDTDGLIRAKCPIKIINLIGTQLQLNDVAFLLKNLPTLEEVLYERVPSVIEHLQMLHQNKNNCQDVIKYNLISLDFSDYFLLQNAPSVLLRLLTLCTKACPKLKTLTTSIVNVEDLNLVSNFSCLENLTLSSSGYGDYENFININGFLISVGRRLKILALSEFSLSLSVLSENCPNLETLKLHDVFFQDLKEDSVKPFKLLQNLELKPLDELFDDVSIVKLLYSCPMLESLTFGDFVGITDSAGLLQFSLDCKLRHLRFNGALVELDFLKQLIINCSSLRTLSLYFCYNINLKSNIEISQFIKESKRKIQLHFSASLESD